MVAVVAAAAPSGASPGGLTLFEAAASPARLIQDHLDDYALTPREAEVVWLMAGGLSNKEIAAHCGISLQTVKDHLKHVYAKAGTHQRTALLARLIGLSIDR